ncbi:MAG: hypothetical protein Q4D63_00480 [Neisseria animaloris]|uniref:hypothetical protein n=1 Tax=Neisseria zoodegmatis TaxID=326523 RepID=UPI0026ED8830|nr:hypothetical protein [Neisseria zoodegmatis]MDO5070414.1 hypothetical protein [Neisseria zoodegmatis]MDO5072860.1 hypothetical protein [Neisseria animaloris]
MPKLKKRKNRKSRKQEKTGRRIFRRPEDRKHKREERAAAQRGQRHGVPEVPKQTTERESGQSSHADGKPPIFQTADGQGGVNGILLGTIPPARNAPLQKMRPLSAKTPIPLANLLRPCTCKSCIFKINPMQTAGGIKMRSKHIN